MKKYNLLSSAVLGIVFALLFSVTARANSSWRWISETRPHDVLPIVIAITLSFEVLAICFISKAKSLPKIILFVTIANIFSFLAPYLFLYITPSLYTFEQTLEHTPFYIVGVVYLLITLIIEVPFVYLTLRSSANGAKKLFFTVVGVNILTTVITAVTERLVCKGVW